MGNLFNMNNFFFRFMGKLFDTVALSIVYVLVCIPIVTIGPATSALYYSTVKSIRRDRSYPIKEFFKAFKRDFKQSFIVGLILVVVGLILYVDVKFAINYIKNSLTYMRYLYIVIGIVMSFGIYVCRTCDAVCACDRQPSHFYNDGEGTPKMHGHGTDRR